MADEDELFRVELESITREFDLKDGETETFDVRFSCFRKDCSLEITVTFDVKAATTLEVVPRAMAEAHRAFAALARQSEAWASQT